MPQNQAVVAVDELPELAFTAGSARVDRLGQTVGPKRSPRSWPAHVSENSTASGLRWWRDGVVDFKKMGQAGTAGSTPGSVRSPGPLFFTESEKTVAAAISAAAKKNGIRIPRLS